MQQWDSKVTGRSVFSRMPTHEIHEIHLAFNFDPGPGPLCRHVQLGISCYQGNRNNEVKFRCSYPSSLGIARAARSQRVGGHHTTQTLPPPHQVARLRQASTWHCSFHAMLCSFCHEDGRMPRLDKDHETWLLAIKSTCCKSRSRQLPLSRLGPASFWRVTHPLVAFGLFEPKGTPQFGGPQKATHPNGRGSGVGTHFSLF